MGKEKEWDPGKRGLLLTILGNFRGKDNFTQLSWWNQKVKGWQRSKRELLAWCILAEP